MCGGASMNHVRIINSYCSPRLHSHGKLILEGTMHSDLRYLYALSHGGMVWAVPLLMWFTTVVFTTSPFFRCTHFQRP